MNFVKILIFLSILLIPAKVYSKDSIRIVRYQKYFHLYSKLGSSFTQFKIDNPDLKERLEFSPNPEAIFSLGFNYSWLGMQYSFNLPQETESNVQHGETRRSDLEVHLTMPRLMVDLTQKKYKGFYLSNPEDFINGWNEKNIYPQVPDIRTKILSANFAYVFKPEKFSAASAYTYTRAMRRSGGSWMLGGFASKSSINSDSCIIPTVIKQVADPQFNYKRISFSDLGLSFGYSHLFAIRKTYFISISFLPGISYQRIFYQSSADLSKSSNKAVSFRQISHFSLGRNGEKCYWGLKGYLESSVLKNSSFELSFESGRAEFFVGYRFDTSNWKFMKKVDKFMHPKPLRFITGNPPVRD